MSKLLFIKEVEKKIGRNRQTIWRYSKDGRFPKPFKVGSQNAWLESAVEEWIDEMANAVEA